ncbi:Gfo/Idh/MocA family oxidoreductase [Pedobacter sp. BS3]|uniref:Gfo/Idh/MocA family protein n=1 Tax=Pedobacter sp. BS3 TaxID=2567937 RepID=UPI0011EDC02B|nr:Gfo/Idh/MocA family oxidoreductase [Pedobacter sp. BS3]TZF83648.1 Gfo/Idh/MocA family oxidoreductase [Pedobacter sp. BS3]
METNRREFLKLSGLAGMSLAGAGLLQGFTADEATASYFAEKNAAQRFNMCGYAAPKLDKVRIGFIGLGNRGPAAVTRMTHIEGVEIKGLCDLRPEKLQLVNKKLAGTAHQPVLYGKTEDDWKKMCERDDIDLVYIATPWNLHTPMAVYAMNHGKHVCVEVPAATTIDECWQLVKASESTKKHCMMLENNCYGFFEMLTLSMARQGFFGEIVHCEGAYIHNLLAGHFSKEKYWNLWRLKENIGRNGNLYPTHGLGPVAQVMNINRGDKMEYLTSVSSNDFMMNDLAKKLAANDAFYKPYVDKAYRGNMNTTTIRTSKGRTIMIQHDVTSPRPKSTIQLISGTKATAQGDPLPNRLAIGDKWASAEEFKALQEQYNPPLVKKIGDKAKKYGGHGGMDFFMDWRTIDCLRNGLPLDQDVYDAALWSAIGPLSEWSVAHRSNSIDVPDFTAGSWKTNKPVDISLESGGTTRII